jgi:hypothetical protein
VRFSAVVLVPLSVLGCASIPRTFELPGGTTEVVSVTVWGMILVEGPYDFVLYSDGHAIYRRWERGVRGQVPRYYTALLSPGEMERLRRTIDPDALAALQPQYDLAPFVSDLRVQTLSVGPPWLKSRISVAVRGLLPWTGPPPMDRPPPESWWRAFQALVEARFSNETVWEPREFFIDVRPGDVRPGTEAPGPSCALPASWMLRQLEEERSQAWRQRIVSRNSWAVAGSHLRDLQDLLDRCSGTLVTQSGPAHVWYWLALPLRRQPVRSALR